MALYTEEGSNAAMETERRKKRRIEVSWPVTVLSDYGSIEGVIKNITVDGVLILCDDPLRLNETYQMSILPPDHKAIGVSGKVVWSDAYCMDEDDSVFGIGVCLVRISDQDRKQLGGILSGLQK
ncbi:MAG: PilZ domain-containing protein [Desulfobacteraceae bacterium]|jgi:hypothetical protein